MTDFNRKQPKVFYGWWIVGAVALISAYCSGVVFYGFTAILEPIASEFGWSYAQVSFAASLRGLNSGILSPLVGFLIDRWGPRKLIFGGAIIIGLGLFFLGQISSLAAFYGIFILISIGTCTCGAIVVMTVVGNWFRRRVSTATGIATGIGAMGGLLVPLITRLIDVFEWQVAMKILGLGAWVILLPLSLVIRHKPEQYGYLPDGDVSRKPITGEGLTSIQDTDVDVRVGQALKSKAFWYISVGFTCHVLVILAVTTHIMPYLSSVGIARTTSSLVASGISLAGILGNISFGWFGDRWDKRRLAAFGLALSALSMLLLIYAANAGIWLLVPFALFFGIGFGGPVPMTSAILREHFGRGRLGTVLGLTMGVMMVGSVIGPPLAGWVFDSSGSYQGIWFAYTGVLIVGIISFLTTPAAGKKTQMSHGRKERENRN
jgi:MFS family permease